MTAHQIYYLKIDRSLLDPRDTAEWVTSLEKATAFADGEARAAKSERNDASGVIKDKDEHYHYVMLVGLEGRLDAQKVASYRDTQKRRWSTLRSATDYLIYYFCANVCKSR
jgi:hypothetical protein